MTDFRLLILGGTEDARALAGAVAGRPGVAVVTSLAGRTRDPRQPAGALRVGGFGGAEGLARYLAAAAIDAAIDATHPFAARISANAAAACRRAGVARLALSRPAWTRRPGDRWIPVPDLAAAAARAAGLGARPFLAVGRESLAPFAARGGRCVARVFEPPANPPPGVETVVSRGPFDEASEIAFLRRAGVDLVVARNSGGRAGYGKIAAARALGLPVLMIDRPPPPAPPRAAGAAEAMAWLEARLAARAG